MHEQIETREQNNRFPKKIKREIKHQMEKEEMVECEKHPTTNDSQSHGYL